MIVISLSERSVNIELGEDKRAWVTTENGTKVFQNVSSVWIVGQEVTIKKEQNEQESES
jgi:hypothetical protein